jgi:hypothetical protein
MGKILFSGNTTGEMSQALSVTEQTLTEGESVSIVLVSNNHLLPIEVDEWYGSMLASGFHISKPLITSFNGYQVVNFDATKGSPALAALIPLIPAVLVIGLVGWGIFNLKSITEALLPLALTVGGLVIIGLAIVRKPASEAAQAYLMRK